jgi:hypothetical protein
MSSAAQKSAHAVDAVMLSFLRYRPQPEISHGLHAVALDEHRVDFSPTLWDADKRIKQMVFSGAHAE